MRAFLKRAWRRTVEGVMMRLLRTREGRRALSRALPPQIRDLTYQADDHLICFDPREVLGRNVLADGSWMRGDTERAMTVLDEFRAVPPGKHVLELGAHIGTQTVYFALSNRFAGVVAVEPSPRNLELLRRNVAINGLQEKVRIVDAAVAPEEGEVDLYLSARNSGAHSILDLGKSSERVAVRGLRIESILAEAGVGPGDIGFVWMDVEGLEDSMAPEILRVLGPTVPVFFEYSPELYGADRTKALVEAVMAAYDHVFLFESPGAGPVVVADAEQLSAVAQADLMAFSDRKG